MREEQGGALAGVLLAQVVADEVQIMMLATSEGFKRQGVATALIQSLVQSCGCVPRGGGSLQGQASS